MIVLMTSCKKDMVYLSNPIDNTTGSFWKFEKDALAGTTAIYQSLTTDGTYMRKYMWLMDGRADDCENVTPISYLMSATTLYTRSVGANEEELVSPWSCHYAGIWRANQVIDNIPGISMDAGLKARCLGEAHCLRAVFYFNLLNLFKNIVVYTHTPVAYTDFYIAQSDPKDVWDLVYSDLKAGIDGCWDKTAINKANQQGRATKGTAAAFLAKAYLMNGRFSDAAPVLKDIIDGKYGTYSLVPQFSDNFTNVNENNDESIFELQYSYLINTGDQGWGLDPGSTWQKQDGYAKSLAPASIGWGDIAPSTWIWNEFHIEKAKDGKDDPRIEATFIFPHYTDATKLKYDPNYKIFGVAQDNPTNGWKKLKWSVDDYASLKLDKNFMVVNRKCNVEDVKLQTAWKSDINRRIIRYADILLLYAECLNETGSTSSAATYLTMVRNRSNMPDRTAEFAGYTKDQMRDQIIHERELELACEWWRYIDLLRWGWFKDPVKLELLKSHDPEINNYVDGREYMAIPSTEISRNNKLKQNPAWN